MNCVRCELSLADPKLIVCNHCFRVIITAEIERHDNTWKKIK